MGKPLTRGYPRADVSSPELSVVCKSCGSEVSPYVTECPYCGNRIRKRAPRLEREGDEIKVRESRRERRRREKRERRISREPAAWQRRDLSLGGLSDRPVATILLISLPALLLVVQRAVPLTPFDVGAVVGPVGGDLWRYLAAPFVYDDIGALLVIAIAIGIFGSAVERRIGSVATFFLAIACGTLGVTTAAAAAELELLDVLIVAGGNGVALGLLGAWLMLWRSEAQARFSEPLDVIGVATVAAVLLLLPAVEITADPIAGLAGGASGLLLGALAARRAPEA